MECAQPGITTAQASDELAFDLSALSVIILAGGQSTRMGQDKALIPIQGVPLLKRTCELALQCTDAVYVVTSRPGVYQSLIPAECTLVQEFLGTDEVTHGPLVGFAQGLPYVETEWVLLLACDLPYLEVPILKNWFSQTVELGPAIALLPFMENGWEPLCGFYRPRCLPFIQTFVEQGGRSFQRWLAQEMVQAIAFSDDPEQHQKERRMLFNCNTPQELAFVNGDEALQN